MSKPCACDVIRPARTPLCISALSYHRFAVPCGAQGHRNQSRCAGWAPRRVWRWKRSVSRRAVGAHGLDVALPSDASKGASFIDRGAFGSQLSQRKVDRLAFGCEPVTAHDLGARFIVNVYVDAGHTSSVHPRGENRQRHDGTRRGRIGREGVQRRGNGGESGESPIFVAFGDILGHFRYGRCGLPVSRPVGALPSPPYRVRGRPQPSPMMGEGIREFTAEGAEIAEGDR